MNDIGIVKPASEQRLVLDAFSRILRREAHVLTQEPDLLWQQLHNRLQWEGKEVEQIIAPELTRRSAPGASPWMRLNTSYRESTELVRTLEGHTDRVNACAISPDGRIIVSASDDKTLRIWDTATGQSLRTLEGHTGEVNECAFSPDGQLILSSSQDHTLKVWNTNTSQLLQTLVGHTSGVVACAFSPAENIVVSGSGDKTLRLWNATTGQQIRILEGHTHWVKGCAFSPDGRFIVSASEDKTLRVWEVDTGKTLFMLEGHTGPVSACAFSPDGNLIASVGWDNTLRLWNAATGQLIHTLTHTWIGSIGFSCVFSPDGQTIASSGADTKIRIWNAITGEILHELEGHSDDINACTFSRDGSVLVSASKDKNLLVWETNNKPSLNPEEENGIKVRLNSFSSKGKLLAYDCTDKQYQIRNPASDQTEVVLEGQIDSNLSTQAFLMDRCNFSPDGNKLAAGDSNGSVFLWDANNGRLLRSKENFNIDLGKISFSPDGNLLSTCDLYKVRIWDTATGKLLHTLEGHAELIFMCGFSPDGNMVASAGGDKTLRLWDPVTGQLLRILGHSKPVNSFAFSPDGRRIASAADITLRIWDPDNGKLQQIFEGHTAEVLKCGFSPDGNILYSTDKNNTLQLWDAWTSQPLFTLAGHAGNITGCRFSPDGRFIISASEDRTLKVWEIATGALISKVVLPSTLLSMGLHPWLPQIVSGIDGYIVYMLEMVGVNYGPLIVTGFENDQGIKVRCPACQNTFQIEKGSLDSVITCPPLICQTQLKVNPNTINLLSTPDKTVGLSKKSSPLLRYSLDGHMMTILACAYSPDGNYIVTGSVDGTIRLWEAATGQPLRILKGHTNTVKACAFSADGTRIVSASDDHTLRVWDTATGEMLLLQEVLYRINACVFSPDGKFILTSDENETLNTWNASSGQLLRSWFGYSNGNVCLFSPDGHFILSSSRDGPLSMLEASTGILLRTLENNIDWVQSCSFSPDGRFIASSGAKFQVWDASTGQHLRLLEGHTETVKVCAFSPDGKFLISGSVDKTIRVWDASTWTTVASMQLADIPWKIGLHPWKPQMVYAFGAGFCSAFVEQIPDIQYGAICVTASERREGLTVRCPACWQQMQITKEQLGCEVVCQQKGCSIRLKINTFVIHSIESTKLSNAIEGPAEPGISTLIAQTQPISLPVSHERINEKGINPSTPSPTAKSKSLYEQANALYDRGDLTGASALYKSLEQDCRLLGDQIGLQMAIGGQANVSFRQGDLNDAYQLYEKQLRICYEIRAFEQQAICILNLAVLEFNLFGLPWAAHTGAECLRIAQENGFDSIAVQLQGAFPQLQIRIKPR